jgi:hypothetical protein
MMESYQQFGDILSFNSFQLLKSYEQKHPPSVGIFTVNDTNTRVLIVGICLFKDHEAKTMDEVFRSFFGLQNSLPRTIITDESLDLQPLIEKLWTTNDKVNAVINPLSIIKRLHRKKKNKVSEESVELFKKLMVTKNPME